MRARLYINHIPSLDLLIALEFGRVAEGQPANSWVAVGERLRYLFDWEAGRCLGFKIQEFSAFDPWHGDTHIDEIWDGPKFDAPSLTQECLSVGHLVDEVRGRLGGRPSFGRVLFEAAAAAEGEEAVELWQQCLEAGDSMAHVGLGRALYGLQRYADAYHHLWYYARLAPRSASAACWHGRVAAAMGLLEEAKTALERAVELGAERGEETNAPELLELLESEQIDDIASLVDGDGFASMSSQSADGEADEAPRAGTVKWFEDDRGFGFITPDAPVEPLPRERGFDRVEDIVDRDNPWLESAAMSDYPFEVARGASGDGLELGFVLPGEGPTVWLGPVSQIGGVRWSVPPWQVARFIGHVASVDYPDWDAVLEEGWDPLSYFDWPVADDLDEACEVFAQAGIEPLPVPSDLRPEVRKLDRWAYATREIDPFAMYVFGEYLHEAVAGIPGDDGRVSSVGEYFAVSHAGHGVNSYALSYHLVYGPLAVFVQHGFGGAYGDRDVDAAAISSQFALIQQLLDVVEAKGLATDKYPGRLIVVENPLRGLMICEWLAGPIGGSADAGDWLREADRNDGRVFWIEGESEPPMRGGALQAAMDAIESFDPGE